MTTTYDRRQGFTSEAATLALQLGGNDSARAVALMRNLARFMTVRLDAVNGLAQRASMPHRTTDWRIYLRLLPPSTHTSPTHTSNTQTRDSAGPQQLLSPSSSGDGSDGQQRGSGVGVSGGWGAALGGMLSSPVGRRSASPLARAVLNPFGLSATTVGSRSAGSSRAGTPLPFGGAPDPYTGQGPPRPHAGGLPDTATMTYEQLHQQHSGLGLGGGVLPVRYVAQSYV